MTQVFLITESDDLRASLNQFLHLMGGIDVHSRLVPNSSQVAMEELVRWVPRTFQQLSTWLESSTQQLQQGSSTLLNAIGIIEDSGLNSIDELDPLSTGRGWSAVLGMLILAFPEIHWVILSPCKTDDPNLQHMHFPSFLELLDKLKEVVRQHSEGFSPLLDPSGLRERVRQTLRGRLDTFYVPLRRGCAAAIDDEESYAYLNGYVCYRFGFRSHIVTSYSMMSRVFSSTTTEELSVTFEDLYLNFADKQKGLSTISKRDEIFPGLDKTKRRIFVTAGHEGETWDANISYLKRRWMSGLVDNDNTVFGRKLRHAIRLTHRPAHNSPTRTFVWLLYKPESGVFDIWNRSGLEDEFKKTGEKAEGFQWPPAIEYRQSGSSHSAPGRLLLIADRMIGRARHLLADSESVCGAVYGAVLAVDAQEYLGYRTPTTSLDAIALKHQLEVKAECMFYGVEYHLDTRRRFSEIEQEMKSVGTWFRSKTREISKVNAELGIISDLVRTYRSFNQFDEEQASLAKLRNLYRALWLKRNRTWGWLLWPARWYIDQLLNSVLTFGLVIIGWLLVFGFIFAQLPHASPPDHVESNYIHGLEDAIVAFFGLQPPHDLFVLEKFGPFLVWTALIVIIMSFLHLGIFVAHLYSFVARR